MAIASILHRISGLALFFLFPIVLYYLELSLATPASFMNLQSILGGVGAKLILWAFGAALIYHLLAGIRHLIMDAGYGEHLEAGRKSAVFVIIAAIILTLLLGFWIW